MKTIALFDLQAETNKIKEEVLLKWEQAITKNEFTYGEYVEALEQKTAQYFGVKESLAVASGTASLIVALKAIGLESGDEVITTPLSFCATADAIIHAQAKPVFVDILEETGNIDPQQIEAAITPKTKAILIVHLYGVPCQLEQIRTIAQRANLALIEDASHAHGSLYRGKPVGSWGQAGCFSLYPSKTLGAFGNAGLIVSNDRNFIEKARMYANHGIKDPQNKYLHYVHGYNELIDNLQAGVVLTRLKTIKQRIQAKRDLAQHYNQVFQKHGHPGMIWSDEVKPSLYVYSVQIKDRKHFVEHMNKHGIETGIYYQLPIHLQPSYRHLGYEVGDLPLAEKFFKQTVSLPLRTDLNSKEIARITQAIETYFTGG